GHRAMRTTDHARTTHYARTTHHARSTRSTTSRDREGAGMPRATCKVLLCDTGRWRCHAGFAAGCREGEAPAEPHGV
ncbi:MAG: hypothetical protein ACK6EB_03170, partial [Planctomyces sp.]